MFESEKKSPLDRLKRALYSRKQNFDRSIRHDIHEQNNVVPESWQEKQNVESESQLAVSLVQRKIYKYLFIFSILFLGLAIIVGAYTFLGGKNFVSVDNIDILIEGPTSISGGEALNLSLTIQNKNATNIELVDLIVEYPEGTKDPQAPEKDLGRQRFSLGDIKSQSIAKKNLSALLFGEEGEQKQIKFTAEYRTAGSNAIFYKEKIYQVSISSSPLLLSIEAMDKVLSNQTTDIAVTVTSNTKTVLKNIMLSFDLPFGFSVLSSNPSATFGNSTWRLGDLSPGAKRTIVIQGSVGGQDGEERTVRVNAGIQSQTNERQIATNIISRIHTFSIEKPFLGLDLTLDGERSDLASLAGRTVRAEIIWTNNSQSKITNTRIEAKLGGNVLDKNSVYVSDGGNYDSLSNTIVFEAGRTDGLSDIAPGEQGRIGFNFRSISSSPGQAVSNPMITVTVSAKGDRLDESGAPSEIQSGISRSVKLTSNLALSSRAIYSGGSFQNTGPLPPQAEKITTYNIIWTVTNTSNAITGARVEATLPAYVSWMGKISPENENITFNPAGGIVTWQVGNVPRNADIGFGARQVTFQISLLPSTSHIGQVPEILSAATITGIDVFTGVNLRNSSPALSTYTSSDLLWKSGNEIVQP